MVYFIFDFELNSFEIDLSGINTYEFILAQEVVESLKTPFICLHFVRVLVVVGCTIVLDFLPNFIPFFVGLAEC